MALSVVKLERLDVEKLRCVVCAQLYVNETSLQQHEKWHDVHKLNKTNGYREHFESARVILERVSIFKCGLCTRGFLDLKWFQKHHDNEHMHSNKLTNSTNNNIEGKPYKCNHCELRFVARSTLEAHLVTHRPFEHWCHCGVGYFRADDLAAHKVLVHPVRKKEKTSVKNDVKTVKVDVKIDKDDDITYKNNVKNDVKTENVQLENTKRVYSCQMCKQIFTKRKAYISHKCSNGRLHQCLQCPLQFSTPMQFREHITQHNEVLKCKFCGVKQRSTKRLLAHVKAHGKDKLKEFSDDIKNGVITFKDLVPCKYCDKIFNKYSLILHERTHTGEKPYVCGYCFKPFSDPSAYSRHTRMHAGVMRYQCKYCGIKYSNSDSLNKHVGRKHEGKPSVCEHCGKTFTNVYTKRSHVSTVHKQNKYICDYCNKVFSRKAYIYLHINNYHMKRLKTQKQLMCDYCKKTFRTKEDIRSHIMRVHMITFYCNLCGEKFVSQSMFKLHKLACSKTVVST